VGHDVSFRVKNQLKGMFLRNLLTLSFYQTSLQSHCFAPKIFSRTAVNLRFKLLEKPLSHSSEDILTPLSHDRSSGAFGTAESKLIGVINPNQNGLFEKRPRKL
jgi:hypothetical protein